MNVLPQFFHPYHDIGFFRKFADLYHQVCGISYIDEKNPIEKTDAERKRQIFCQPVQRIQNVRVDQKIVHCTEHHPEKCKQRTDNALDIAPTVRIIPQLDFHAADKDQPCHIFQCRDRQRHDHKEQDLFQQRIFHRHQRFQHRQQVQHTQTGAIQRQIRPYQKSRIHPVVC